MLGSSNINCRLSKVLRMLSSYILDRLLAGSLRKSSWVRHYADYTL